VDTDRGGVRSAIPLRAAVIFCDFGQWEEMSMSNESILVILLVGLIAGWLAGQIVRGTGYGLVADICIGIIGALIGSWLLPQIGIHLGAGIVSSIVVATIGAIVLLVILRLVNRGGRW
jgi:uncharacterized membrane protein YeaQ/YmgE (transglycosylase-associated protein family)